MTEEMLEQLIVREALCFSALASLTKRPFAWFLHHPDFADYGNANHALRLRDDGRGPEAVADEILTFFRQRGLIPTADVDAIAERQGLGAALRRRGVTPVMGDRLLMRWEAGGRRPEAKDVPALASLEVPVFSSTGQSARSETQTGRSLSGPLLLEVVPPETGAGEAAEWVETALCEDIGTAEEAFWREIYRSEAQVTWRRQYLARWEGEPAGVCQLTFCEGWGRIDDVVTKPSFRRRGIASALVSRAVQDSRASGDTVTYLFTEADSDAERLYRRLGFTVWAKNPLHRHRGTPPAPNSGGAWS